MGAQKNARLLLGMFILECRSQSNLTFITSFFPWLSVPRFKCPRINMSAVDGKMMAAATEDCHLVSCLQPCLWAAGESRYVERAIGHGML